MATENEIKASLETSEQHIKSAHIALRECLYSDCSYHSASAAENAGNALILALGGRVPRTHRNAEAIEMIAIRLKPEWLKKEDFKNMLEKLRDLEEHVVKSRYPIKIKEGTFVPPSQYYTDDMARNMLEKAVFVVETIKKILTNMKVI